MHETSMINLFQDPPAKMNHEKSQGLSDNSSFFKEKRSDSFFAPYQD